jgi:pyruvate kinase
MTLAPKQLWFTYGPQTTDDVVLEQLIASSTGARLTFSYGTQELQLDRAKQLKGIAKRLGKEFIVVADLQGEKTRFAKIDGVDAINVRRGESILIGDVEFQAQPVRIPLQFPALLKNVQRNDILIEGDGALLLRVESVHPEFLECIPDNDGVLHPGRGFVVQSATFVPSAVTPKDVADAKFVATRPGEFDWLAVSFASQASDIEHFRRIVGHAGQIIAKIETRAGVQHVKDICKSADAVMAARGDLALMLPWEELPAAVGAIADAARVTHTPWIVATQLMEGLERFAFPTRPEICDLAHWLQAGATGAMLSYETAFGSRPFDAISCVQRLIQRYGSGSNDQIS